MPSFIIKVSHNDVIRKIGIVEGTFPSFTRLSDKIRSVFSIPASQSITASKVIYSPDGVGTILLSHHVSSDSEWKAALSNWGLYGKPLPPKGSMRMTINAKPAAPKTVAAVADGLPALVQVKAVPNAAVASKVAPKIKVPAHSYESDSDSIPALVSVDENGNAYGKERAARIKQNEELMSKLLAPTGTSKIAKPTPKAPQTIINVDSDSSDDDEMPGLFPAAGLAAIKKESKVVRPVAGLSDDEGFPDLIELAKPKTSAQRAVVQAASSVSETLHSTLQSSLKTLETLRRLSPPSSSIPLASSATANREQAAQQTGNKSAPDPTRTRASLIDLSGPSVYTAFGGPNFHPNTRRVPTLRERARGQGVPDTTFVAPVSTAVTREDLASALASTKEDIKGILSSFLESYAGKMADTFGAEDVKKEEDAADKAVPAAQAETGEHKELEVWFDTEGQQIQVWCDGCGKKVGGLRFKCVDCSNYDLCSTCAPALSTTAMHSVQHRFKPISHPLLAAHLDNTFRGTSEPISTRASVAFAPAATPAEVRHNASCDFCSANIDGKRYKCLTCPDFDSCESCFGITPEQHPGHSFVKISDPADYKRRSVGFFPVLHRGVVCDGCDSNILGVRYKCVHPDCADYDLCESCEAAPIATHPRSHPLLKLRTPLQIDAQTYFDDDQPRVASTSPVQEQPERATPSSFTYGTPTAPSPAPTPVPTYAAQTPVAASPVERSLAPSPAPATRAPSFVADLTQPESSTSVPATPALELAVPAQAEDKAAGPALMDGLHARFDADITVKDAASFPAGALFVKTWRLQNNGTVAFDASTALRFSSGEKLQAQADQVDVGAIQAGETFEVSVEMKAPETAGRYVSFWRLKDGKGDSFGDRVWTDIIVVDPSLRAASPGTSSMSSSSIVMPAAPSVAPAASILATDNSVTSGESAGTTSTDSGSDIESVADGSEMSAFGEIDEHEHNEAEGFSDHDEEDEEEFVVVQDERA